MTRAPGVLLALAVAGWAVNAVAQEAPARVRFELPWILSPQQPDDTILSLSEGDKVTAARLLPGQFIVNETDLLADNGRLLAPSGREFTRAISSLFLACTIRSLDVDLLDALIRTTERYLCVIDDDQDGSFDRYFTRGANSTGILPGTETVPTTTKALGRNAYAVRDREQSKDAPQLEFKYDNYAWLSKWILFRGCIRISDSSSCRPLQDTYGLQRKELPGRFSAFGGEFELLEKTDDGIRIRMTRPFRPTVVNFTL